MRYKKLLPIALILLGFITSCQWKQSAGNSKPQNVILLIPDGFGPASATMARQYLQWRNPDTALAFDSLHVGSVRTNSAFSRFTGSAAAATAYATGVKTYIGGVGVDTLKKPRATILEAAENRGMATGIVVSSSVASATPAAFASHVPDRDMHEEMSAQMMQQDIEVLFSGLRDIFLPESEGGMRQDGRNLWEEARSGKYTVITERKELLDLENGPVLGLFSDGYPPLEMVRNPDRYPGLEEMTAKAIELLKEDPDGYLLIVEGSRIDGTAHSNDAPSHLHEILAFNKAFQVALKEARLEENTLVISAADHETGGLTLARNVDDWSEAINVGWKPNILHRVKAPIDVIFDSIKTAGTTFDKQLEYISEMTGIDNLSAKDVNRIENSIKDSRMFSLALGGILAERALIDWTTRGHSAVDVNLYAYGPGSEMFIGNHDNTYVGKKLAELMGFNLNTLTDSLRKSETNTLTR